mmetsp:Transcript_46293/g.83419  ORF Transcript_46293/g.83419 Transcript_46293/m.83419 type:complete len:245 (+) Transcript_46293:1736-2470(+)
MPHSWIAERVASLTEGVILSLDSATTLSFIWVQKAREASKSHKSEISSSSFSSASASFGASSPFSSSASSPSSSSPSSNSSTSSSSSPEPPVGPASPSAAAIDFLPAFENDFLPPPSTDFFSLASVAQLALLKPACEYFFTDFREARPKACFRCFLKFRAPLAPAFSVASKSTSEFISRAILASKAKPIVTTAASTSSSRLRKSFSRAASSAASWSDMFIRVTQELKTDSIKPTRSCVCRLSSM